MQARCSACCPPCRGAAVPPGGPPCLSQRIQCSDGRCHRHDCQRARDAGAETHHRAPDLYDAGASGHGHARSGRADDRLQPDHGRDAAGLEGQEEPRSPPISSCPSRPRMISPTAPRRRMCFSCPAGWVTDFRRFDTWHFLGRCKIDALSTASMMKVQRLPRRSL